MLEEELLLGSISSAEDRAWSDSIRDEFVTAFDQLRNVPPGVTVFGSARVKPGTPLYQLGVDTGYAIANAGFPVITGGGPGLMSAANEGARLAGGTSIGLGIDLPHEQNLNPHLTLSVNFEHFFVRKLMLVRYACAFVALPGGFGTMDELFETLTLVQTGKVREFPVILLGTEFWGDLHRWIVDRLIRDGYISPEDVNRFLLTDDIAEAVDLIVECNKRQSARMSDLPLFRKRTTPDASAAAH